MNPVLKVDNLYKKYKYGIPGVKSTFYSAFIEPFMPGTSTSRPRLKKGEFWALKNISFSVKEGEILGIIGPNGSGKSTLLKIISRITPATHGDITVTGSLSSLLEVGTGFHPELTGRENIYLNGAILGIKRKYINSKLNEIIDFSGIEKFIDTPVKRYSSGMYTRLAFAVSAYLNSDILIVDEVLSVGDAEFQKKSLKKMKNVALGGRTVIYVSHNLTSIRQLCTNVILLKKGQLIKYGKPAEVIEKYLDVFNRGNKSKVTFKTSNKRIQFMEVSTNNKRGAAKSSFRYDEPIYLNIKVIVRKPNRADYLVFQIHDNSGNLLIFSSDEQYKIPPISKSKGTFSYKVKIPSNLLTPGKYYLTVSLSNSDLGTQQKKEYLLNFDINRFGLKNLDTISKRPALVLPQLDWELKIKK